ncbi:MAG: hypothetical protein J0M15_15260 [Deltaproteobacteria bacterium]|jgi:hypothetical protein|nr:hypothetical protein [Deltaproteobacteria bacterium]
MNKNGIKKSIILSLIALSLYKDCAVAQQSCATLYLRSQDETAINLAIRSVTNADRFDRMFEADVGTTPKNILRNYIEENSGAGVINKRLEQGRYSVALMAPQKYLRSILTSGFKNFHETGYSEGLENLSVRKSVEMSLSGLSEVVYQGIKPDEKPIYAMLWPDLNSKDRHATKPEYGDIVFILKKANILNRTTWSPLDSFDLVRDQHHSRIYAGEIIYSDKLRWYQRFIPMARFPLATIFTHEYDKVSMSTRPLNRSYLPKQISVADKVLWFVRPTRANSYLEFQIWGSVKAEDIEAIVFLQKPPNEESVKDLKKLGIKIFNGQSGQRVLWDVSM